MKNLKSVKVAELIYDNLAGRSGIGNEFDQIDEEILQEIKDKMAEIIAKETGCDV